jgi:predicted N-acetyltransferase YhbS
VPTSLTRRLGRYEVPVFRLGRLAVALDMQRHRIGSALLFAAGRRALAVATEVGGIALVIDAKDDRAAGWYERFGALRLLDDPRRLILPLATIAEAVERG